MQMEPSDEMRKECDGSSRAPVGQRVEVAADAGDELVGGQAAGIAGEADAAEEAVEARGRGVAGRIDVEGAAEGGDSAGEVAAEALPFLGRREGGGGGRRGRGGRGGRGGGGGGGVAGRGGRGGCGGGSGGGTVEGLGPVLGLHEDLLHRVLVRARPPGPTLQRRCHATARYRTELREEAVRFEC